MVDSLRDQLLKSGIVKPRDRETPPDKSTAPRKIRTGGVRKSPRRSPEQREVDEIGLAKAYALRSQTQIRERQQLERAAAEQARLRRERKERMQELLMGKVLNLTSADHARHFEYAGKIRRVYVDAEQLRALNLGELGIVQQGGRYLVVTSDVAKRVQAIDSHHLVLLVEPDATSASDDGVPDDLIW